MPRSTKEDDRKLNVTADAPDLRDRYYEPSLSPLKRVHHPPGNLFILDQGSEGACTGYGLAATINLLYRFQGEQHRVSPRMLYEMARRYDEWPGEAYKGSSCRGAIKGWQNTGVCLQELEPTDTSVPFTITPAISADAKLRTLGAYYRLRPELTDFHAAIGETGVIYASAKVHEGWKKPVIKNTTEPYIPFDNRMIGGHAFAIVGYNEMGFWVQNSWGPDGWGKSGIALWLYEDWAQNLMDAWVVQMALPVPQVFGAGSKSEANKASFRHSVPRHVIEHHFVHIDDGHYHNTGRYWSNTEHIAVVQNQLKTKHFDHLLLYAHGGLNSTKDSARRILAMKDVFLANGVYPFHFMYDTGLTEELKDVIFGKREEAVARAGGIRDWLDRRIEDMTRKVGRAIWREMKYGARKPFETKGADGSDILSRLISTITELDRDIKIHLVGHSTGAILHAYLLDRLVQLVPQIEVSSCSLLAPAATHELFEAVYVPLLENGNIKDLAIYNLKDRLEQDDNVARIYGKSLLYLVSNAFEEMSASPLLGMEKYEKRLDIGGLAMEFVHSYGTRTRRTASDSHGGFDNDPKTMNDLLKRVVGRSLKTKFSAEILRY